MGTKNASTVAQNAYTKAMNTHLNTTSRDKIANFADDFCAGQTPELIQVSEDFVQMCHKAGIHSNQVKSR